MAFITTDLDAIDRAIASGELTVRTNDRLVTYRSFDDLIKARGVIAAAIAASAPARMPARHALASFSDD